MPHPIAQPNPARRRMPLRHKLMLALACEILLVGFRQADFVASRAGILIESPILPHHAIA
ncbi:hypothetical protein ASF49_17780 [Methylobacterium sp. Leaf104]|uniref:hypothetical protein n=1 Tax=Methylobacterium TaxID=407 RepID=UPI0006F9A7EF|nr:MULTISPECIES: hypothetical protein [Methylobacterium]KQP41223.1 hypothetical protein ASF49_17780 [Methylobacterium sp. Leaf104]MCI9879389.1 hypothetical protein [Methylobacterium goesingense]